MAYNFKIKGLKELVTEEDNSRAEKIDSEREKYRKGEVSNSLVKIGTWKGSISDIDWSILAPRKEIAPSDRKQIDYGELSEEVRKKNPMYTKMLLEAVREINRRKKIING